MRRERLQGETIDLVWVDERPDEQVYSELLARTSATDGQIIVSYTPVGEGAAAGLTYRFLSEPSADRAVFRIPSEEARHISAERREELAANYLETEREARLEGTPQLGAGRSSTSIPGTARPKRGSQGANQGRGAVVAQTGRRRLSP
jgi:phage terminase large subunit-like protein